MYESDRKVASRAGHRPRQCQGLHPRNHVLLSQKEVPGHDQEQDGGTSEEREQDG